MSALDRLPFELHREIPLGRYTSLRVGGPARWFLSSDDATVLVQALAAACEDRVPTLMLGGGSNLLVADAGVDGVVLRYTASGHTIERQADGNLLVKVRAGTSFSNLARRLARDGVGGLEWGASVPGTIGGAVVNNAGAFGGCLADHLYDAEIMGPDGTTRTLAADDLRYAYRTSVLKRGELGQVLVTSARLRVQVTDSDAAMARILSNQAKRTASQPRQLSAGSIFANPPGDHAGRLLEAAGLKGTRRGTIEISTHHANFIVNTSSRSDGAMATGVFDLIRLAQDAVWQQFAVWLKPEVQLAGRWSSDEAASLIGPPRLAERAAV
jgi:UDP-N-acetylmuramate dehydrogenase